MRMLCCCTAAPTASWARYHAACLASAGLGLGRDARALGDVEGREDLRRRRVDADGLIEVCLGRPAAESERKALGDLAWSGVRLGLGLRGQG